MNKAEWILLIVIVAALVGPFVTIKALAVFKQRGKLPPALPYKDDED